MSILYSDHPYLLWYAKGGKIWLVFSIAVCDSSQGLLAPLCKTSDELACILRHVKGLGEAELHQQIAEQNI